MPTKHSLLSGADLHEPKGIETANPNTVYAANGSGSGSWVKMKSIVRGPRVDGDDSAEGFFVSPVAGTITRIVGVLSDEFESTASTLVFEVKDLAGSVLTNLTFSADGSAKGVSAIVTTSIPIEAGGFVTLSVAGTQSTTPVFVETAMLTELS